eukprot:SAG31_NODE_5420_length_2548_cov_1.444671_4_plen_186_part_00
MAAAQRTDHTIGYCRCCDSFQNARWFVAKQINEKVSRQQPITSRWATLIGYIEWAFIASFVLTRFVIGSTTSALWFRRCCQILLSPQVTTKVQCCRLPCPLDPFVVKLTAAPPFPVKLRIANTPTTDTVDLSSGVGLFPSGQRHLEHPEHGLVVPRNPLAAAEENTPLQCWQPVWRLAECVLRTV